MGLGGKKFKKKI